LLIEKVISIAFLSPVTVFLCSCYLLHGQENQNLGRGNAVAALLSVAIGCTLLAHIVPGMSQKLQFPSCSATSLMICF